MKLIRRHLEGNKFLDSNIDTTVPDLFQELVDSIEFDMNHVTPFDV